MRWNALCIVLRVHDACLMSRQQHRLQYYLSLATLCLVLKVLDEVRTAYSTEYLATELLLLSKKQQVIRGIEGRLSHSSYQK